LRRRRRFERAHGLRRLPRDADIVVIGAGAAGIAPRGASWRRTAG